MPKQIKVLNSEGKPILHNQHERKIINHNQRIVNDLGFEIDISTLTAVMKRVVEQKFFEIAPADYMPVRVGEGAWSTSLETYRSFSLGDDFEKGLINTGSNDSRLASADAGVDSVNAKVLNWAKSIGWSLFDLQHAAKSGNWDLVTAKERARKKNWDLGIQRVAFLGTESGAVKGLLNQPGIAPNTTRIGGKISAMTPANFTDFLAGILGDYRAQVKHAAMPTHFVIPENDYLGLAAPSSSDHPLKSKLDLLLETFRTMTSNPSFQILPCAYAEPGNSQGELTNPRYALYNFDEDSLRMDIPVDYTNTLANSIDSFKFQNVGYGQFTGLVPYRVKELMYFDDIS